MIWSMRISTLVLTLGYMLSSAFSQDIHFSQFFNSPLDLNPANTGLFDGDLRFNGIYRSQWSSVTVPFSTISLSADAQGAFKAKNLGIGASLFNDRAGDSRLNTFQFNVAGSYGFLLNESEQQRITIGVQTGITSRTIDPNQLSYDSQYNGLYYDPSLSNDEAFARTSRLYPNMNVGVIYGQDLNSRDHVEAGISFFNLNQADQSFYDEPGVALDARYNLHFNGAFAIAEKWDLLPSFQFMGQGKFRELILGASGRYVMLDQNSLYRAFSIGVFYRASDAGYLFAGIDNDNWRYGISYDFNLSELTPASRYRGAIEISIGYIIKQPDLEKIRHRSCPDFL